MTSLTLPTIDSQLSTLELDLQQLQEAICSAASRSETAQKKALILKRRTVSRLFP